MDAIAMLKTRRSIRTYLDKPVPKDIISDIVDCGRLAATAMNRQPWHFVVICDRKRREHIASLTDYGKFIAQAPVCIAVFGREVTHRVEDCSAATQNILLAAKAHNLASCWIAGDKKPYSAEIEEYLGAPRGVKLFSLITIGYSDAESNVEKKPLEEVIHWEKF